MNSFRDYLHIFFKGRRGGERREATEWDYPLRIFFTVDGRENERNKKATLIERKRKKRKAETTRKRRESIWKQPSKSGQGAGKTRQSLRYCMKSRRGGKEKKRGAKTRCPINNNKTGRIDKIRKELIQESTKHKGEEKRGR